MMFNELLDVLESAHMMAGTCATLAVIAGTEEEEEGDPGEFSDGNVYWGSSLGGSIQGLDNNNKDGPHSFWRRIFFLIGHHLSYQPKV